MKNEVKLDFKDKVERNGSHGKIVFRLILQEIFKGMIRIPSNFSFNSKEKGKNSLNVQIYKTYKICIFRHFSWRALLADGPSGEELGKSFQKLPPEIELSQECEDRAEEHHHEAEEERRNLCVTLEHANFVFKELEIYFRLSVGHIRFIITRRNSVVTISAPGCCKWQHL